MRITRWLTGGIFLLATACAQPEKAREESGENPVVNFKGVTFRQEFKDSLQLALEDYHKLTVNLAFGDTSIADMRATLLGERFEYLAVAHEGLDTNQTHALAMNTGSIAAELKGMYMEKAGLEGRRIAYHTASEQLYDFLKLTGVPGKPLYWLYCKDAFGGKGAYWLAEEKGSYNPYMGRESKPCEEVKETLK